MPIEFRDESGRLHLSNNLDFYEFGHVTRSNRLDIRAKDPGMHFSSLIVDGIRISNQREHNVYDDIIHVIGDIHDRFVAGKDDVEEGENNIARIYKGFCSKFIAYHVGPGLTFNLDKYGSKTGAREKIERLFDSNIIPKGARVMFSFGEIDCRFHVCRQAEAQGHSIDYIISAPCDVYIRFLDKISEQGYRPMVWAPFSTTWLEHWGDPDHPIYGSYSHRYRAVMRFNQIMCELCKVRNFGFISLFYVVNDSSGNPIQSYFCDPLHLSQSARKFIHYMAPNGELIYDLMVQNS